MPVTQAAPISSARPKAATRDLRFSMKIKAKPERIYKALTSARELCRWWLAGAETDARSAGRFRMIWPRLHAQNGGPQKRFPLYGALGEAEGYFVDLNPNRKVSWMWKMGRKVYPPLCAFFIEPRSRSSCELTLVHGGFSSKPSADKYYRSCALGWEDCLAKLKLYLEKGRTLKTQVLDLKGLKSVLRAQR